MPFQVSPGVNVSEIDLTTVVPAVSSTEGAIAGVFRWGPVDKRVLVDSEAVLAARFGKPTNLNAETFFTAANFLAYGNKLYVTRTANTTANTLVGNSTVNTATSAIGSTDFSALDNIAPFTVKNEDAGPLANSVLATDTDVKWVARYPGDLGNSLKVSVCATNTAFSSSVDIVTTAEDDVGDITLTGSSVLAYPVPATGKVAIKATVAVGNGVIGDAQSKVGTVVAQLSVGDKITVGNTTVGVQTVTVATIGDVTAVDGNTAAYAIITTNDNFQLLSNATSTAIARKWEYADLVDAAPGVSQYQASFGNSSVTDEIHVVVADEDGKFTGVPGTVLELWQGLSRATDAKTQDGGINYFRSVLIDNSSYIWPGNLITGISANTATLLAASTATTPSTISFQGGNDGSDENNIPLVEVVRGYDLYRSAEDVDVSLILTGVARGGDNGETLPNYLIDNIADTRKDCVVFVSPAKEDVVNNSAQDEADDIITFRNSLRSSSYAVLDSGYKYQYDKYNDMYRWIPMNGDIAGLCVRTDDQRDAWWSPAGFNRGQIKNIVKLAYNPRQADRDQLYKAGVNPVVTFPGQGTVLYGDKTLLAKPSAFDRINVRRLFIVLEKAIATAAKYTMFEFNDDFTRAQFRNLVEPFLRDVQGRRGIYDFKVVCDGTNNTGDVIDRNEFVGDIYIKPAKSINFIQLNFVAVRTGVEFSEVVGQF